MGTSSPQLFPAGAVINCEAESFEEAAAAAVKWNMETTQLQRGVYRFSMNAVHTPALQLGRIEDHCKAAGSVDRHRVARRAAGILKERCREDLSMSDLCEAVGANRRTLHLGFLELYGIPPMKYLRALRLCRVRREIRESRRDPDIRVTDVAMAWGFSHLGRFSADYRSFFGELPSADMTQASPACRIL